jgi:hypothetical protein
MRGDSTGLTGQLQLQQQSLAAPVVPLSLQQCAVPGRGASRAGLLRPQQTCQPACSTPTPTFPPNSIRPSSGGFHRNKDYILEKRCRAAHIPDDKSRKLRG